MNCVITGIGAITALGSADETFNSLLDGKSGIGKIERLNTNGCYTDVGAEVKKCKISSLCANESPGTEMNFSDGEYKYDCKYYALLYNAVEDAINDAQVKDFGRKKIINATCSGNADGAIFPYRENTLDLLQMGRFPAIDYFAGLNETASNILGYGTINDTITISTACSSGTVAISLACDLIKSNIADTVIVMGSDIISDIIYSGFLALHALDENSCRPFSGSNGLTLGDGAGALVIESEEHAKARNKDWYCYALESSVKAEANHITSPDETGESQAYVMRHALTRAGLKEEDFSRVNYICAHGTGTPKNDAAESLAISKVFGKDTPYVGSFKSGIGHTLGSSGILSAIMAAKMFQKNILLPNVSFENPGINKDVKYIGKSPIVLYPNYILSNSFAFGGNDASVLFGRSAVDTQCKELESLDIRIIGFDFLSNTYDIVHDQVLVPSADIYAPKNLLASGLDGNLLRKMDIYSRCKCVSIKRALENANIDSSLLDDRLGLLGFTSEGSSTITEGKTSELIYKNGNSYGDATEFPNSVYNAGDGWATIALGIKGYTSTFLRVPNMNSFESIYPFIEAIFKMDRADVIVVSIGEDQVSSNSVHRVNFSTVVLCNSNKFTPEHDYGPLKSNDLRSVRSVLKSLIEAN